MPPTRQPNQRPTPMVKIKFQFRIEGRRPGIQRTFNGDDYDTCLKEALLHAWSISDMNEGRMVKIYERRGRGSVKIGAVRCTDE